MSIRYLVMLSTVVLMSTGVQALAHDGEKAGTTNITTGFGEDIHVKHGLLGNDETVVKDRFGDGFAYKKGILGGEDQKLNVFGNGYTKHRGTFGLGGTKVQAQDVLGDKFYSHKTLLGFGPRETNIDVSGATSIAQLLLGKLRPATMMTPDGHLIPPGMGMMQPGMGMQQPPANFGPGPSAPLVNPSDFATGQSTPAQDK